MSKKQTKTLVEEMKEAADRIYFNKKQTKTREQELKEDLIIECRNCNSKWSIEGDCVNESFFGFRAKLIECPLCYLEELEEK